NAYEKKYLCKTAKETLSIDSNKATEEIGMLQRRAAGETLSKKKRVPELQELQVEDKNLRMLKKDIRRIAKWHSKIN
ncbi:18648_t:CDS:2, partial [Gigaspora rosea]